MSIEKRQRSLEMQSSQNLINYKVTMVIFFDLYFYFKVILYYLFNLTKFSKKKSNFRLFRFHFCNKVPPGFYQQSKSSQINFVFSCTVSSCKRRE